MKPTNGTDIQARMDYKGSLGTPIDETTVTPNTTAVTPIVPEVYVDVTNDPLIEKTCSINKTIVPDTIQPFNFHDATKNVKPVRNAKGGKKEMWERQKRLREDVDQTADVSDGPVHKAVCLAQKIETKKQFIADKKADFEIAMPGSVKSVNGLQEDIKSLKKKNMDMSAVLTDTKKQLADCNHGRMKILTELDTFKTANMGLHTRVALMNKAISSSTEELVMVENKITENKEKMKLDSDEIVFYKTKIETLEADISSKDGMVAGIEIRARKLVDTNNQLKSCELKLLQEREKVEFITRELTSAKKDLDETNKTLAITTKSLTDTKKELADSNHRLMDFDHTTAFLDKTKQELSDVTMKVKCLEEEKTVDKLNIETHKNDIVKMKSDIFNVNANMQAREKITCDQHKSDIESMTNKVNMHVKLQTETMLELTKKKQEIYYATEIGRKAENLAEENKIEMTRVNAELLTTADELDYTKKTLEQFKSKTISEKKLFEDHAKEDLNKQTLEFQNGMNDVMVVLSCEEGIEGPRICQNSKARLLPPQDIIYTACEKVDCYTFFKQDSAGENMFNAFHNGSHTTQCRSCKSTVLTMKKSTVYNAELSFVLNKLRRIVPFKSESETWDKRNAENDDRHAKKQLVKIVPLRAIAKSIGMMMMNVRCNDTDTISSVITEELEHLAFDESKSLRDATNTEAPCLVVALRQVDHTQVQEQMQEELEEVRHEEVESRVNDELEVVVQEELEAVVQPIEDEVGPYGGDAPMSQPQSVCDVGSQYMESQGY